MRPRVNELRNTFSECVVCIGIVSVTSKCLDCDIGMRRGEGRGEGGGDNVVWIIYFVSRVETDRNFDEYNFHVIEYKKSHFHLSKARFASSAKSHRSRSIICEQIKSRTFKDTSHWQIRRTECQLVGDRLFRAAALWHVASGWGWRWKRRLHGVLHSLRPLYMCLCPFRGALVTVLSPFLLLDVARTIGTGNQLRYTLNRDVFCGNTVIRPFAYLENVPRTLVYVRIHVRTYAYVRVRAKNNAR